tara:strand:+ start:1045 stop:1809 length:765 start_codon:yes stop_codon:yes gene_type:complete
MIKYNFAKDYSSLSLWKPKKSKVLFDRNTSNKTSFPNYINQYISKFPKLANFAKENKLLFVPSISILSLILIIEAISIIPKTNIRKLQGVHFDYEDKIAQLNNINMALEKDFESLLKYSNLYAIGAPDYIFAYYLQLYIPKDLQLSDYTIDNTGFKVNAIGNSMDDINKFLNFLLSSDLIENDSLRLVRLVNQSTRQNDSFENSQNQSGIFIEVNGKLSSISLENRIRLNKLSYNDGMAAKLGKYLYILNLFKR